MSWSGKLFIVGVTVDAYAMVGIMPFLVNRRLGKRQSGKSVFKKVMSSTSSIDKKFDFTFLGNSYGLHFFAISSAKDWELILKLVYTSLLHLILPTTMFLGVYLTAFLSKN